MKKNWRKVDKKFYTDIWDCIKNKTTNKNTPCAFKQFCTKTGPEPHLFCLTADEKERKYFVFHLKTKKSDEKEQQESGQESLHKYLRLHKKKI